MERVLYTIDHASPAEGEPDSPGSRRSKIDAWHWQAKYPTRVSLRRTNMNDEQPIQLGKWYGLLIFAAGSILTAIMSALDFGVGPMGGRSPGLGITLLAWTIIGGVIGVWILRGHSWRQGVERDTRLRLAVAYFAVSWGGLFGMTLNTPSAPSQSLWESQQRFSSSHAALKAGSAGRTKATPSLKNRQSAGHPACVRRSALPHPARPL